MQAPTAFSNVTYAAERSPNQDYEEPIVHFSAPHPMPTQRKVPDWLGTRPLPPIPIEHDSDFGENVSDHIYCEIE